MRLKRRGIKRNCGWKTLFKDTDLTVTDGWLAPQGGYVIVNVTAAREKPDSSYEYELKLLPEDILRCALSLSHSGARRAICKLADEVDIAEELSQLVKKLLAGAITAASDRPKAEALSVEKV